MIENILTLLSCIYLQKYDYMNDNYFLSLIDHAFTPFVVLLHDLFHVKPPQPLKKNILSNECAYWSKKMKCS